MVVVMRPFSPRWSPSVLLLLAVSSPSAVLATDGVIEINQARALAGSVTPGDAAGFPVYISVSGSYRLTSNLTVPNENTDGIDIGASEVTIDLNGFSILGPTVCSGGPPLTGCTPSGFGYGAVKKVGGPPPT